MSDWNPKSAVEWGFSIDDSDHSDCVRNALFGLGHSGKSVISVMDYNIVVKLLGELRTQLLARVAELRTQLLEGDATVTDCNLTAVYAFLADFVGTSGTMFDERDIEITVGNHVDRDRMKSEIGLFLMGFMGDFIFSSFIELGVVSVDSKLPAIDFNEWDRHIASEIEYGNSHFLDE